jgi:antitoxin component of MazEF toxin-antitoxin module
MASERVAKVRRVGPASLAVVIPKDWCRGNEIEQGDLVVVRYNGEIRIRPLQKVAGTDSGVESDG